MQQTARSEDSPEETSNERRLVGTCSLFDREIEATDMASLRTEAQRIVDERGEPGDTYHIAVHESNESINQIALCAPERKRRRTIM